MNHLRPETRGLAARTAPRRPSESPFFLLHASVRHTSVDSTEASNGQGISYQGVFYERDARSPKACRFFLLFTRFVVSTGTVTAAARPSTSLETMARWGAIRFVAPAAPSVSERQARACR